LNFNKLIFIRFNFNSKHVKEVVARCLYSGEHICHAAKTHCQQASIHSIRELPFIQFGSCSSIQGVFDIFFFSIKHYIINKIKYVASKKKKRIQMLFQRHNKIIDLIIKKCRMYHSKNIRASIWRARANNFLNIYINYLK
jgi:hypothetical protein